MESISKLVKDLVAETELTHEEIGKRIGIKGQTVATWSSGGRKTPQAANVIALAALATPKLRLKFLAHAKVSEEKWTAISKALAPFSLDDLQVPAHLAILIPSIIRYLDEETDNAIWLSGRKGFLQMLKDLPDK